MRKVSSAILVQVAVLATLASAAVRAGDVMDTRLTWTFGDDDVLHKTGKSVPLSPDPSIGDRSQYRLFFDNLNSRFSGRENITHLVMYKKMPGYIERLDTEAALVVRLDLAQLATQTNNLNAALYDSGSYLRVVYHTTVDERRQREGVDLTLFPLDTDRFRLGYLYDLSWGGTNVALNQSIFPRMQGSAPGAKVQLTQDRFYVFGGFKTASIVQIEQELIPGTNEVENVRIAQTNYGFLGGAGVDVLPNLRLDAGGGYFQQGRFELPDVIGKSVFTYGGSGRIVVHEGMPVPQSVDFLLYRNDPNAPLVLFAPEKYDGREFAWALSFEGSRLEQRLKDFDRPRATADQPAHAAALQFVAKAGYVRGSVTGIYRDLAFVMRNQPSYVPFQTLPRDARVQPETFFSAAVDYYIESLRLRPGVGAGVQFPATFRSDKVDVFGAQIGRTVVVRQQGDLGILPYEKTRKPIVQARASVRLDLSDMMALVGWAQIVHDNNRTLVERDPSEGTVTMRTFVSPQFFGFGVSAMARF